MGELNRRRLLKAGGALSALGAMTVAAPSTAWSWSPAGSVAGTGAGLDPRWVWDDPVDSLIADVIDRGDAQLVNDSMKRWIYNGQAVPSGAPADVQEFMNSAIQLPAWADLEKLDVAFDFCEKWGLYLGVLYGMNSGMMSTAIPREARAVYYSKGGWDLKDRISKTAKLGKDIGDHHAYRSDGKMSVTCARTRMTHAGVRHLLPQSPHWVAAADEEIPISQRDIMVTWHSLASSVWQKLMEWDIDVPDDEAEAYLHLWQVTASMLGVLDEYIPATWADALAQREQILVPLLGATPEGIKLADMLLDLGKNLDATLVTRPVLESFTRYMLGNKITDSLKIPRHFILDPTIRTGWPIFVKIREFGLNLPLSEKLYWTFEELIRVVVLIYMSEGIEPILIDIPTANNPNP
ncbi:uncharacterized protein DUF2236 [Mumia flava]|uniref:Uncharacterized protein DUF2236 n=1 Tax=Mumia flava TaxID=1348852 RepID=A0A0B2BLL5_9ACTN|nr:oxygenase MpaB family protein [Mumia flava]PJJ54288.1 uncharacterized protein DUF2236 [Mumia flava]